MSNNILQLVYGLPKKIKKIHQPISRCPQKHLSFGEGLVLLFIPAHYLLSISFNQNEKVLPI